MASWFFKEKNEEKASNFHTKCLLRVLCPNARSHKILRFESLRQDPKSNWSDKSTKVELDFLFGFSASNESSRLKAFWKSKTEMKKDVNAWKYGILYKNLIIWNFLFKLSILHFWKKWKTHLAFLQRKCLERFLIIIYLRRRRSCQNWVKTYGLP